MPRSTHCVRIGNTALFVCSLAAICQDHQLAAAPLEKASVAQRLDEMFAAWNRPDSPGCVVGVVRGGQLIHAQGYGSANLSDEVPNRPETIFALASFSKSVTCACLAMLMDQGRIDPDDDMRKYVPEMHAFDPPVRLRHMVRCHSGLWAQFHILPLAGFDNVPIHSPYSKDDLLTILSGQTSLPFQPGAEFQYGSGEYFLLALIIERVSGKTLAEFANEHIFEPLEMTRTFYDEDPTRIVKHRALAYYKGHDGVTREWRNHGQLTGGGGLNSCLLDLHKWERNFRENRLPAGQHLNEFIEHGTLLGNRFCLDADAYRKKVHSHPDNAPAGQYRGLKRIQFTGGWWGMTAAMARFPEHDTTVICLSNNDDLSALRYVTNITDVVLADQLGPRFNNDPLEELVEIREDELRNKAGFYQMDRHKFLWRVDPDDEGGLRLTDRLHASHHLKPISATSFRPVGASPFYRSAVFEFVPAGNGERYTLYLRTHEGQVHENIRMRPVEVVNPSADALGEYAGTYVSAELGSTYRITVNDGALWLRVNSRRRERLDPGVRDEFIAHKRHPHDARVFRFLRDAEHQVTGLDISFWRIRSLKFDRQ